VSGRSASRLPGMRPFIPGAPGLQPAWANDPETAIWEAHRTTLAGIWVTTKLRRGRSQDRAEDPVVAAHPVNPEVLRARATGFEPAAVGSGRSTRRVAVRKGATGHPRAKAGLGTRHSRRSCRCATWCDNGRARAATSTVRHSISSSRDASQTCEPGSLATTVPAI
jgi:hypothetical protein